MRIHTLIFRVSSSTRPRTITPTMDRYLVEVRKSITPMGAASAGRRFLIGQNDDRNQKHEQGRQKHNADPNSGAPFPSLHELTGGISSAQEFPQSPDQMVIIFGLVVALGRGSNITPVVQIQDGNFNLKLIIKINF